MKSLIFLLTLLFHVFTKDYSFVVMSNPQIGYGWNYTVDKINSIKEEENIKFVFILGDITQSAIEHQYNYFNSTMKSLKVEWFPLVGERDILQFNSSWEERYPTGDHYFYNTFNYLFKKKENRNFYHDTVQDQFRKIHTRFHNFEIRDDGNVFIGLDWTSRFSSFNPLSQYGTMPTAMLHDYPGGTFQWLESTLRELQKYGPKQIILLQHHPLSSTSTQPAFIYGFSNEKRDRLKHLLLKYFPKEIYSGVFSGGHLERETDHYFKPFSSWKNFFSYETTSIYMKPSFTLVHIHNNKIRFIEKLD